MKIGIVLGTRPEILKNYSVVKALRELGIEHYVIHTNQHSDHSMSGAFFEAVGYTSDFVLDYDYAIGRAIDWVRSLINRLGLDLVIVNGDTAAALVGAVASLYSDVGIAHIEAGLRSGDREMYEERNRIVVDSLAHYLFTYTNEERRYLESVPNIRGRVFHVGNTTVDLITDFKEKIVEVAGGNYLYVTLHRKEFTDRRERMITVFEAINALAERFDGVIFPVHPRTRDVMRRYGLTDFLSSRITVLDPISVFESLSYEKHARLIMTDSGCIQEEAYIFGVPCVTVRENTERHGTVRAGANLICGYDTEDIMSAAGTQLEKCFVYDSSLYGEGGSGERIARIILENFKDFRDY